MAGPTYGAAGTRLAGATATTAQLAVPASVVSGSVIVAVLYRGPSFPASYDPFTSLPSGFALVPDNPGIAPGNNNGKPLMLDIAWKRASGADTGTYDFAWTDSSTFRTGVAVRIDGCRATGNPFDADDGATDNSIASSSTPSVAVTTLGPDRLLIWVAASWTTGAWTMPSGFTQQVSDVPLDLATLGTAAQAVAGSSGSLVGSQANNTHAAWVGSFTDELTVPPRPAIRAPGLAATQAACW